MAIAEVQTQGEPNEVKGRGTLRNSRHSDQNSLKNYTSAMRFDFTLSSIARASDVTSKGSIAISPTACQTLKVSSINHVQRNPPEIRADPLARHQAMGCLRCNGNFIRLCGVVDPVPLRLAPPSNQVSDGKTTKQTQSPG